MNPTLEPINWNPHACRNDCDGLQVGQGSCSLPTVEGQDGVHFDGPHQRVYVSGGKELPNGFVYVYQRNGPDQYETIGKIRTRGGAGTSFWSHELNRYYVAVPANSKEGAAILVYAPAD